MGRIAHFNNERLRFAITLSNSKQILVKACNLGLGIEFGPYDELCSLYESAKESENMSVLKLEEIWEKMRGVCDDRRCLAESLELILTRIQDVTADFSFISKFIKVAEDLLADMEHSGTKVDLAIKVSEIYSGVGKIERRREILYPLLDKHHGRILEIMMRIQNDTIHRRCLPKVKFILKHGVYRHSQNVVHGFVARFLRTIYHEPKYLNDARIMMSFLKDELCGTLSEVETVKKQRRDFELIIDAQFAMMEGRYEDAIAKLTVRLQALTLQFGRNSHYSLETLKDMVLCYADFGDKKRAKQALNRLKRMNKNDPQLATYEGLVAQMREGGKRSMTKVGRTLCKCSNPYCSKVEQKKSEFGLCAKCERVKYCSRECQVQHFKAGHKNECGK